MEPSIYNCHVHTFTADHVPDRFLPFGLVRALRRPWLRKPLLWLFGVCIPLARKDIIARTGRFLARGVFESQEKVFRHLQRQYPQRTRFIVLSVDLEFMGAGKPAVPYEEQLRELAALRDLLDRDEKTRGQILPFCALDPRRPNLGADFRRWVREYRIKGVKIYPSLGYRPDDPRLVEIYGLCETKGLPVMAHCSPGGIRHAEFSAEAAGKFAHPENYRQLLKKFPNLNFCLAHFGGAEEWERHITGEAPRTGAEVTWLSVIADMMRSGDYPNLYADVAYTLFTQMPSWRPFNYFHLLKVLLTDQNIRRQTLFGTDYYMVEREKVSEKEVSLALRAHLGEDLYFRLAHDNPRKFLYEQMQGTIEVPKKSC